MQTSTVDPATIAVWRWQMAIATLGLAAAAGIFFASNDVPWVVLVVVIALIGLIFGWFWPAAYFQHLRFGVDDTGIVIERGVMWRSRIALPRARIQHTDVSQGPLQRRYGVGTLKLFTAGSRYTKIELSGLAYGEAIALRDALLAQDSASGV